MAERLLAILLYEDSRAPVSGGGKFGPHELLCQVVADVLGEGFDGRSVGRRLDAIPKKGVDNVIASCRSEFERFRNRADHVVAVVDDDKIRRRFSLGPNVESGRVIQAFEMEVRVSRPEFLHVVLFARNIETLLQATARALGKADHPVLLGRKPRPNERDGLCMNAVQSGRHVRDAIVQEVPSSTVLRDLVASWWRAETI